MEEGASAAPRLSVQAPMSTDPTPPDGFLAELRHRKVIRVAIVYAAVGFIIVQVANNFFPALQLPVWTTTLVAVLVVLGFPLALVMAWAFELTPDGVRRAPSTRSADSPEGAKRWTVERIAAVGGVVVLALGAGAFFMLGGSSDDDDAPPDERQRSIAVLPFANLSADAENEYLSDGIAEDIRGRLSRLSEVRVISRTSAMSYRGSDKGARLIGEELGVGHLLEGSVRRSGDRLRIAVQLVDARTDETLWTETYDRDVADIFAIQSAIAEQIADALRIRPTGGDRSRLTGGETSNLMAYELYLKGLQLLRARAGGTAERRANIFGAVAFLRQSIELDPEYALPHAALAWAYEEHPELTLRERRDSSRTIAERVIGMAPELPDGYAELGWYHIYRNDGARAGEQFRLALARDPSHEFALAGMAGVERAAGRFLEAVEIGRRVVEVNPADRASYVSMGNTFAFIGDFDEAEEWFRRGWFEIENDPGPGHCDLTWLALYRGNEELARHHLDSLRALDSLGEFGLFCLAQLQYALGDIEAVRTALARGARTGSGDGVPTLHFAALALHDGDRARAETLLEEALSRVLEIRELCDGRCGDLQLARIRALQGRTEEALAHVRRQIEVGWHDWYPSVTDPFLASLEADPRFIEMMDRLRASLDRERERVQAAR
jgi:TolB-like protein/tetratricopeptide (TPR) repeat protein